MTNVPNTFADKAGDVDAALLDENFDALEAAIDAVGPATLATIRGDVSPANDTLEKIESNLGVASEAAGLAAQAANTAAAGANEARDNANQAAASINTAVTGGLAQIDTAKTQALGEIGEDNASGARGAAITAVGGARGTALTDIESARSGGVTSVTQAAGDGQTAVNSTRDAALDAIGADNTHGARGDAITAIGADNASGARGAAITAITTQQATSVGAVAAQGTTSTAAVNNAGATQLAAIASVVISTGNIRPSVAAAVADPTIAVNSYFVVGVVGGGQMVLYQKLAGPTASGALFVWASAADPVTTMRMAQAQYDSQVSMGLRAYPAMAPMRMYMGTLTGGAARNADGTYHMPAASKWRCTVAYEPFISAGTRYLYVVLVTPTADAVTIAIWHGGSSIASTTVQIAPGIYKVTWSNTAFSDYIEVEVTAVTTVDVRPFELYSTDSPYLPQIIRFDDTMVVPENRTIIDWDKISPMARFGSVPLFYGNMQAQFTVSYDSLNGNAANSGTAWTPKKDINLHGTAVNGEKIGLKHGSYWNQSLTGITGAGNTAKGVMVIGYSDNEPYSRWPWIDGGRDLSDRVWTADTTAGIWFCDAVTCDSALVAGDGYSFATIVTHKTSLETAQPMGCENVIKPYQSLASLRATTEAAASFAVKPTSTSVYWYVKTPDGLRPDLGGYKYKGCTRFCPLDWDAGAIRSGTSAGLIVTQGCYGYGGHSGGPKNLTVGMVAAHGWTHTFKMEAGEARDMVLYNGGNKVASAGNCYIGFSANGYSWRWHNVIGFKCQTLIYSHNASGTYDHGEISYVWAWQERDPVTGSLCSGDAYACDAVAKVLDEWNLTRCHATDGRAGTYDVQVDCEMRNKLVICNSVFKSRRLVHDCVVWVQNFSDPSDTNNRFSKMIQLSEGHVVRNCLFYANNYNVSGYPAGLSDYRTSVFSVVQNAGLNNPSVTNSIFIIDTQLADLTNIYNETNSGMVWTSNGNLIIFCAQGNLISSRIGSSTKTTIQGFLDDNPGHDTTTVWDDRRDDVRRAKSVLMDPSNGDFRWAQTAVAAGHKATCIANNIGPWWTIKNLPNQNVTVDEAIYTLTRSKYG